MTATVYIRGCSGKGRGLVGKFSQVVTDVTELTPRQLLERDLQRLADAEKSKRAQAKAIAEEVERETREAIKKAGKRDTAEVHTSTVRGEASPPDFQNTIPAGVGGLVVDIKATEVPPKGSGGGGGDKPPETPRKGGDFGKDQGSLLGFAWKIALICMLVGCLTSLVIGLDKVKSTADIALLRISELTKDMEYGSKIVASLSGRLTKTEGDINSHTTSIQAMQGDLSKTDKTVSDVQGRLRIVESSVVDPKVIARNAENVAHLEGDVKAVKRNTARTSAITTANAKAIEDLKKADAEKGAAIEMLKDAVATLKPKDDAGQPGAKGSQLHQKGGYRLSSMTFMDGSGQYQKRVEIDKDVYFVPRTEDPMRKVPSYKDLAR